MAKASAEERIESPEIATIERRRSERAELLVRVHYRTVDQLFSDFARNINEGGLFVETDAPHDLGTFVDLEFQLPGGDEPIAVRGLVVRRSDGSGGEPPGMGIEFDDLADGDRRRIDQLVRQLRSRR